MQVEVNIQLIGETPDTYRLDIGADFLCCHHKLYRAAHFCFALHPCDADAWRKTPIAACFHGLWCLDQPNGQFISAIV